jgi:D-alanine-D-alanine ligase
MLDSVVTSKKSLALICGGQSGEHEISLLSAFNVLQGINLKFYDVVVIGISKKGLWSYYSDLDNCLLNVSDPKKITLNSAIGIPTALITTEKGPSLIRVTDGQLLTRLDIAFPILHGPFGEDGLIQGLFKLYGLPYVGSATLSSSMTMDKDVTKRLLQHANIPVVPFLAFDRDELEKIDFESVTKKLGLPIFVKPANAGSSLGVSKVTAEAHFKKRIEEAFRHDRKILIETAVMAREIECAVLGNTDIKASVPGEIIPRKGDFYSYVAKYLDDKGAELVAPAELNAEQIKRVQQMAILAYKVLGCEGLARVDFFLTSDDRLYINEINTMPGFTNISMYPRLWGLSGIPYAELIETLIQLGLSRSIFFPPA